MSSSNDIEITTRPDSTTATSATTTANDLTTLTTPSETVIITTTTITTEPSNNKPESSKDIETIDTTDSANNNKMTTTLTITPIFVNGENGNSSLIISKQQPQLEGAQEQNPSRSQQTNNQDGQQDKDQMDRHGDLINFKVLYVLAQLCGLTLVVMMASWVGVHMGGVSWRENPKQEFFWHPILMTIGLIYLYGNGILVYRGFRNCRKKTLKLTHAGIHLGVFITTVISLVAVFDSHNLANPPIPNMYSLHSWLGLACIILFSLQYVCGFIMFLVPGAKENLKVAFMPLHVYFGLMGFIMATATALMGLTEKAIWSPEPYSILSPSAVLINIMGILLVIFAALVTYMVAEPSYSRKPIPEDTQLLTGANE